MLLSYDTDMINKFVNYIKNYITSKLYSIFGGMSTSFDKKLIKFSGKNYKN
jgi:hypothetical protein